MNYSWHTLTYEFFKQSMRFAPKLLSGLLIFCCFWLGAKIAGRIVSRLAKKTHLDTSLVRLLAQVLEVTILIFGAITALGTVGINVGALIAGLGLSGFALGLAMKDALSNLMAGISILLYRPFQEGDRIRVTGLEGKVIDINLRYTVLLTTNERILIPNSNLFTNPIQILNRQMQPFETAELTH